MLNTIKNDCQNVFEMFVWRKLHVHYRDRIMSLSIIVICGYMYINNRHHVTYTWSVNDYSIMYTHFVQKQHRQVRVWTWTCINAKNTFISPSRISLYLCVMVKIWMNFRCLYQIYEYQVEKRSTIVHRLKTTYVIFNVQTFPRVMKGPWLLLKYLVQCTFSDKESNLH